MHSPLALAVLYHIFVDAEILKAYQKAYAMPGLVERAINKLWRTFFGKNLSIR